MFIFPFFSSFVLFFAHLGVARVQRAHCRLAAMTCPGQARPAVEGFACNVRETESRYTLRLMRATIAIRKFAHTYSQALHFTSCCLLLLRTYGYEFMSYSKYHQALRSAGGIRRPLHLLGKEKKCEADEEGSMLDCMCKLAT